jgi:UDP-N-acetyl-D-mannosaminuronic acid dehydrogenase
VDPWFIVHSAPEESKLIRVAREVNDRKPSVVIEEICQAAAGLPAPIIACLGLAFKPDIDDLRESPALEIVRELAGFHSARILVVEPNIEMLPPSLASLSNLVLLDVNVAVEQADVVVFLVNHKAFSSLEPVLLDGKKIVNACGWRR